MMKKIIGALALTLWTCAAQAQGTLPISLTQQFSFSGCSTAANACGTPLIGGLLYTYQVGTVATRQNTFQDTALTIQNPWPLPLDANGRVPAFYLANGSVHIRLTDASGVVQFDYPSALVIGPSGGSGGSGGVDPTTIFTTGDLKFRPTGETITGWVKANGLTIGSATSGATGRANADTQNLFVYLWINCHLCTVAGGKGASGLADFNANKTITVYDCRARICGVGVDDMGNSAAGILLAQNITSVGDTPTTPGATAGEDNHTLTQPQLPAVSPTFTGTQQTWSTNEVTEINPSGTGVQTGSLNVELSTSAGHLTVTVTPAGTISALGSGSSHNVLSAALTGSWYVKL
jgi:hypothetical protein